MDVWMWEGIGFVPSGHIPLLFAPVFWVIKIHSYSLDVAESELLQRGSLQKSLRALTTSCSSLYRASCPCSSHKQVTPSICLKVRHSEIEGRTCRVGAFSWREFVPKNMSSMHRSWYWVMIWSIYLNSCVYDTVSDINSIDLWENNQLWKESPPSNGKKAMQGDNTAPNVFYGEITLKCP